MAEPDPVDMHVGQRLRALRRLKGYSQGRLAELLGVKFQQVQKYENGANRIGASVLFRLGLLLEAPLSEFFDGLEPAGKTPGPGLAEAGQPFRPSREPNPESEVDRRETLEMVRAFNQIDDPLIRRRLFALAKSLAALS